MATTLEEELEALESKAQSGEAVNPALNEEIVLDFSDVTLRDNSPMPEGIYLMEVKGVAPKRSKEDNNYLEIELAVVYGDHKNRRVWDRLMLSGKGAGRFVIFADALGMYDSVNKTFRGKFSQFLGQKLWVKLKIEGERFVEGKTYSARNQVSTWDGYENISAHPLPAGTAEAIANSIAESMGGVPDPFQDAPKSQHAPNGLLSNESVEKFVQGETQSPTQGQGASQSLPTEEATSEDIAEGIADLESSIVSGDGSVEASAEETVEKEDDIASLKAKLEAAEAAAKKNTVANGNGASKKGGAVPAAAPSKTAADKVAVATGEVAVAGQQPPWDS